MSQTAQHENAREQAAVLALVRHARSEWYLVSQLLEITGSAERVVRADWRTCG